MKNLKKLATLLLALVMVLSLATTAFADDSAAAATGTITITNAIKGQTYNVYKMFDLESQNGDAYSYTVESAWTSFVTGEGAGAAYVKVTNGYVELKDRADLPAFAKAAKKYAADSSLTATGTAIATADGTVTITGLDLGYYVIDSTLGTVCSLTNTDDTFTAVEKNEAPTAEKKIVEGSSKLETNDVNIGDTIEYQAEIKVKAGAVNYKFIDTMSTGLTLNESSIKVQVDNTDVATDKYTVKTGNDAGNATFTIEFNNEWLATQVGKTIVITYNATLNENAVIAGEGNKNTANLEYGNKSDTVRDKTPDTTTTTKTWKFDVEKFTSVTSGDSTTEQTLAGATFTLSKNDQGTDPLAFIKASDNVYRVAKTGETGITSFTTDNSGKFTLQGLDSGTYYLTETAAPSGYNKLAGPVTVTIGDDGSVKKDAETTALADGVVKVENKTGSVLPSTGGMGTTLFYVLGAALMLGAAVILITKRRMNAR